jgi:DNA-nicking Smr family endonuclease
VSSNPPKKTHSLSDLGALKGALQKAAREEAERVARERAEALRLERERNLFTLSVGPVQPLPDPRRVRTRPVPPQPEPRQRQRDEQAALRETISDEFDVENLLETDDTLSYRRMEIGLDVVRKLRRGGWTIQAQLDLHGLRRDEARGHMAEFLRDALHQGLRCVRIVHGKGLGSPGREPVLKTRVRNWLAQRQEVLAFVQARPADGGAGALVVLLRAPSSPAGHG